MKTPNQKRRGRRKQLITNEQAVPAKRQHKGPCSDCPWARKALNGWLGPYPADTWIGLAHGEAQVECHTLTGVQCAGMAIYRSNVCKTPRDPDTLRLPADRDKVFASHLEFKKHHES